MDSTQVDSAIHILSVRHFKKPNDQFLIRQLAEAYTSVNNIDSALVYWQMASLAQPGNDALYYAAAQLYYQTSHPDSSLLAVQKASVIAPDNINYLSLVALSDYRLNRAEVALSDCEKILVQSPADVNALLLSGIILRDQHKDSAALKKFDKCVHDDPANTEALLYRADEYVLLKQYTAALRDYSAARADVSGDPDILNNIGICQYQSGAYRQAIVFFEKAIAINHLHPQSYYNRGLSFLYLHELDSASVAIKTASAIWDTCYNDTCHANFMDALYYLGMCYKNVGDLTSARAHFLVLQKEKYPVDLSSEISDIDHAIFMSRSWYYFLIIFVLIVALLMAFYKMMRRG